MKENFGSINDCQIDTAIDQFNNSDLSNIAKITKSQIEVCKDCEFRDVCIDCRAYRESDDIYSKPKKCNYNPYTGKWITLILFTFLFNIIGNSQQNNLIVIDSAYRTPIPFCKMLILKSSSIIYSNEKGVFVIDALLNHGDSLTLFAYGYKSKKILYTELKLDTIFLDIEEKINNLQEVVVKPLGWKKITLNEFKKPEFGNLRLDKGGTIATFIHQSNFANGFIEKIHVYIKEIDTSYFLRMKLFNYDVIRNCPGQEIMNSESKVDFTGESRWYSITLSNKIFIPANGICIGFEVIPKDNQLKINKNQCNNSSVNFGSYYEKLENGNRTSFTSLKSNNWYTPGSNDLKVDNVLNLAVKIDLNGKISVPNEKLPKFITSKKVERKINQRKMKPNYDHSTIEKVFKSIITCIEKNELIGISELIKVEKTDRDFFNTFLNQNEENWLNDKEQKTALIEWNYFLINLDKAEMYFLSENYSELSFPDGSSLTLFKEIGGWKISPTYKKYIHLHH